MEIIINYHRNQRKIFETKSRFKLIAKGRRFGLTRGLANYVIERMMIDNIKVLWVDTIYANIERYYERYFSPVLKGLEKELYQWRAIKNDLKILGSVCDFRSADRPENIEGFGYNLIVVNEAGIVLKNRRLWEETIAPMILDYKGEVIIGGTPKGKKAKGKNHLFWELFNSEKWERFQFSSYDNPLLDKNEIRELEETLPANLRRQEIYGEFIDTINEAIVKREWWRFYRKEQSAKSGGNSGRRIYWQSWDTAYKEGEENDYSVCTTWEVLKDGYYLVDMWRGRVEFPALKRKAVELYERYIPVGIMIEDKASGQSLIQELKRETRMPIVGVKVNADKITRVNACSVLIESGKVFLPEGERFTKDVIDEFEEFPNGENDDIVDSVSQFLNEIKKREIGREVVVRKFEREKRVW